MSNRLSRFSTPFSVSVLPAPAFSAVERTTRGWAGPPRGGRALGSARLACDAGPVPPDPHAGDPRSVDRSADPVLERRRRIARLVRLGSRTGYALFGVAIALFVVGLVAGFGDGVDTAIVAALALGSVVLAPAIVFGHAVRAAERDDREHGRPTME